MNIFEKSNLVMNNRDSEILEYVDEYMKMNFIYESFHATGSTIKKSDILNIMRGSIVESATLNEHIKIKNFLEVFKYMDSLLEMDMELTSRYLMEFITKLKGTDRICYRKSNPTLREYVYTPPHFLEIDNKISEFDRWIVSDKANADFFDRLSEIYFRIFEIYPLEEDNVEMANLALCYEFKRKKIMISSLMLSDSEHSEMMRHAIKYNTTKTIKENIMNTLEGKLDHILEKF